MADRFIVQSFRVNNLGTFFIAMFWFGVRLLSVYALNCLDIDAYLITLFFVTSLLWLLMFESFNCPCRLTSMSETVSALNQVTSGSMYNYCGGTVNINVILDTSLLNYVHSLYAGFQDDIQELVREITKKEDMINSVCCPFLITSRYILQFTSALFV